MIDNTRGILWMSASVVVFIFNDALIKLAAETMPAIQAIGLRGVFASLWCGLALALSGTWRQVPTITHRSVLARGVLEAASSIFYLVALFHIPFAIATAVNMSTPLFLAVLAVIVLREDVRWRRWCAIALGFVGVLMVIQPRLGDANLWTWVVVFASFLGASRDILGRYVPRHVPALVVSLGSALALALVGCVWTTVVGWQPMSLRGVGLVAASSLLLAMGYQTLMLALRTKAEISVMAAFRYSSVLWALVIGYIVWGDLPNRLAFAGIVVVAGSGLYILRRQRERAGPQRASA